MRYKRFYWFAYEGDGRQKRLETSYHQLRDGGAASVYAATLAKNKLEYADILFNRTPSTLAKVRRYYTPEAKEQTYRDLLSQQDLLLLTTRPPINDAEDEKKWPIYSSQLWLEERINESMGLFFSYCSRNTIGLAEAVLGKLDKEKRELLSAISFQRHHGSDKPKNSDVDYSLGYLVYHPSIYAAGPGVLAGFAVSGTSTLVWARWVNSEHPERVAAMIQGEKPALLIGSIERKKNKPLLGFESTLREVQQGFTCDIIDSVTLGEIPANSAEESQIETT